MINLQVQIFLLLAIGRIAGRVHLITKEGRAQLASLVMNLVLPAAIIRSFQMELTPEILKSTIAVLVLSTVVQFGCILLAKFVWKGVKNPDEQKNLQYGTVINNAGTMGMVIAEAAFGEEGLLFASVYMIPVRILMWTYGITLYSSASDKKEAFKKAALHPCVVAIYIGIVMMALTSAHIALPVPVEKTLSAVANCNTALCMLVIGAILSDIHPKHLFDKLTFLYSGFRLLVLPALLFVLLKWLPFPALAIDICIVEAAMPAPSTMAMLAQKYKSDPQFASKMIFSSTLFSLLTLPFWSWLVTTF